MPQRDVSGRYYLTKADLNALYFATFQLPRPRGWTQPFTLGLYWRGALVLWNARAGICQRGLETKPDTIRPLVAAAFAIARRRIRFRLDRPVMNYLSPPIVTIESPNVARVE